MTPGQSQVDKNSERIAVVETRTASVEVELLRVRERLHELESDRATVRLLVRQVSDITTNVEKIAQSAAEKAVEMALEKRSQMTMKVRSLHVAYLSIGIAGGGLVATLITTLQHG